MPLHLNIRESYKIGEPVAFLASIDPGEKPLKLKTANPYQIWAGDKLIHQPSSPRGATLLEAHNPLNWSWDQRDQMRHQVAPGNYELHFFAKKKSINKFEITATIYRAIKSASKWCKRACAAAGPVITYFDPISGTMVSVLTVPFELIENDPPASDYDSFAEPVSLDIDADWISNSRTNSVFISGLTLFSFLAAMRKTIERQQGAMQAGESNFEAEQENHLLFLSRGALQSALSVRTAVNALASNMPADLSVIGSNPFERVSVELEKQYMREAISKMLELGMIERSELDAGIRSLSNSVAETAWEERHPKDIIGEFDFEFGRFADTLSEPPAEAKVA